MDIKQVNNLQKAINCINKYAELIDEENINIMEVCGTHTNSIAKYGINSVISNKINLLSGPGCPVCVTNEDYIDEAVYLAFKDITIVTFGDLVKVWGNNCSLAIAKYQGRDIRIIYSISEVVNIAKEIYPKEVVFLAVGFETTAPSVAAIIKKVYEEKIQNLSFLTSIKIMPPILHKILNSKHKKIHGIICPGNVAVIRGGDDFKFIYQKYKIPAVICGFEGEEILASIYFLVRDIYKKSKDKSQIGFENLYRKWASPHGNKLAQKLIKDVFNIEDVVWRGIGNVENSALIINDKYSTIDATKRFDLQECLNDKFYRKQYLVKDQFSNKHKACTNDYKACKCKDVLLGNIYPFQCGLFRRICKPEKPFGPCMVSEEGACAVYYKYHRKV